MGQSLFKKHSIFQNFDENFYCGMKMSLFKKYSNFQKFDEILYCGMTRFRNVKLGVFRQYQNAKTILKKKNMGQNYTILVNHRAMAISRNSNRFLMGNERSLSQKGIIKVYERIPI